MTRIRSIQVLRAVAALGVVFLHSTAIWDRTRFAAAHWNVLHLGAYGVDLFFVISGFIICSTARSSRSAADFLRRRFVRVAPVYYVQTAPYAVGLLAAGKLALTSLATSLLFWPVWGSSPTLPILEVGWSLGFEALFYTGLAFTVWSGRKGAYALLAAYAAAYCLNLRGAGGVVQFVGSPMLVEFLFGVAIAYMPAGRRPLAGAAAILAAAVLVMLRVQHGLGPTYVGRLIFEPDVACLRVISAGPPAFLIVWGALQLEPWRQGAPARALGYLGDASYSIYLTHPLVIVGVEAAFRAAGAPMAATAFLDLPLGVAGGVLAYEVLEKPLLAALRGRRRPVAAAAE